MIGMWYSVITVHILFLYWENMFMKSNIETMTDLLSEQIGLNTKERMKRYAKWNAYWNHIAKYQKANEDDFVAQNVISALNAQEGISKEFQVLEIGCGTGAYTLDFAAKCKHVTAVDMSEQMLCVLKKRAAAQKITNITYHQSLFENLPENKQYDFVFAAMCPAVCDYESLMKFERLSKNHCCLVSVAKNSSSKLRKELRMQLTDKPLKGLSPDIIYQFHLLYALGRYPTIQFVHSVSNSAIPLEEAIERYQIYFDIFGYDQPKHHDIIRTYLSQNSENGMCTDNITYHMAIMNWKIGQPQENREGKFC